MHCHHLCTWGSVKVQKINHIHHQDLTNLNNTQTKASLNNLEVINYQNHVINELETYMLTFTRTFHWYMHH